MRYSSYFKQRRRSASKAAKVRWAKQRALQDELILAQMAGGEAVWCVPEWRGKLWRIVTIHDSQGTETLRMELWTPKDGEGRIDQVRVVIGERSLACMGMTRVAGLIRKTAVRNAPGDNA